MNVNNKKSLSPETLFDYTVEQYLKAGRALTKLCQPLFNTSEINYFGYFSFDIHRNVIAILTNLDFLEYYLRSHFYSWIYSHVDFDAVQSGYYEANGLLSTEAQRSSFQQIEKKYKIFNRFLVVRREQAASHTYSFAFSRPDSLHLNFCINNIRRFDSFIDSIVSDINVLKENLVPLPLKLENAPNSGVVDTFAYSHAKTFLGYSLDEKYAHRHLELNHREKSILYQVLLGKTAKEISVQLMLSARTIENNLERIKEKYQCRTKNELIAMFVDSHELNRFK